MEISAYAKADGAKCDKCKGEESRGGWTSENFAKLFGMTEEQMHEMHQVNPITGVPSFLEERVKSPVLDNVQTAPMPGSPVGHIAVVSGQGNRMPTVTLEQLRQENTQIREMLEPRTTDPDVATADNNGPVTVDLSNIKRIFVYRDRSDIKVDLVTHDGEVFENIPAEWRTKNVGILDYLSVSKMDLYQQCPAKFKRTHLMASGSVDEDMDDGGNIFTWFGSILHEVCEYAENAYQTTGITVNPLMLFDEAWRKRQLTDFAMYKEAKDLITDYFNRNPVHIKKYKILGVEVEWKGQLGDVPVFGCKMDKVGEINPETGVIVDYKTNRQPYTQFELEDSLQLHTYELIARILYPQYKKWVTGYELFRFGWQQCPERTQDELDSTRQFINNINYQITHDTRFEERLNNFCGYCDYKFECKAFCDYVNNPSRYIDILYHDGVDMDKMEESRQLISTYYKIIEQRKKEIEDVLRMHIQNCHTAGSPCVIGGKELYLTQQERPSYDYAQVRDFLAIAGKMNLLDGCLSIGKTKFDAAIKNDPQLALELKKFMTTSYTSPYIMTRKAKQ
jgi:hypothetical protein